MLELIFPWINSKWRSKPIFSPLWPNCRRKVWYLTDNVTHLLVASASIHAIFALTEMEDKILDANLLKGTTRLTLTFEVISINLSYKSSWENWNPTTHEGASIPPSRGKIAWRTEGGEGKKVSGWDFSSCISEKLDFIRLRVCALSLHGSKGWDSPSKPLLWSRHSSPPSRRRSGRPSKRSCSCRSDAEGWRSCTKPAEKNYF